MGPFEGLSIFFDDNLVSIAKELEFSNSNIAILQHNEEELARLFPNIYGNILSCTHHRDGRSPIQYAKDLVASWIFEDYILAILKKNKISIILAGADRNREVLSSSKTTTESDYLITCGYKSIHVELMSNYTDFWTKTNKLHLRDGKYKKLTKSESIMICISPISKYFFLIDFRKKTNAKFIASHWPYGGKPAYELSISNYVKHEFEELLFCETIRTIL